MRHVAVKHEEKRPFFHSVGEYLKPLGKYFGIHPSYKNNEWDGDGIVLDILSKMDLIDYKYCL